MTQPSLNQPQFIDNPIIKDRPDHYETVQVATEKVIKSWQLSLFSYEWLTPDGQFRVPTELPEKEQKRRQEIEEKIKTSTPLEIPVLGIGLMENIEIGSGKTTFLTLAAEGIETIPVHVPKSHRNEFTPFLS